MSLTPKPKTDGVPEFSAAGRIDYNIQDWIDYCLKNEGKQITVPFNLKEIASPEAAKFPAMAEDVALATPAVRPGDPNSVRGVRFSAAEDEGNAAFLRRFFHGKVLGDIQSLRKSLAETHPDWEKSQQAKVEAIHIYEQAVAAFEESREGDVARGLEGRGNPDAPAIVDTFGSLYRGDISPDYAVIEMCAGQSKEKLAEFLVDAFNRGWITPFNLGLNEDGERV